MPCRGSTLVVVLLLARAAARAGSDIDELWCNLGWQGCAKQASSVTEVVVAAARLEVGPAPRPEGLKPETHEVEAWGEDDELVSNIQAMQSATVGPSISEATQSTKAELVQPIVAVFINPASPEASLPTTTGCTHAPANGQAMEAIVEDSAYTNSMPTTEEESLKATDGHSWKAWPSTILAGSAALATAVLSLWRLRTTRRHRDDATEASRTQLVAAARATTDAQAISAARAADDSTALREVARGEKNGVPTSLIPSASLPTTANVAVVAPIHLRIASAPPELVAAAQANAQDKTDEEAVPAADSSTTAAWIPSVDPSVRARETSARSWAKIPQRRLSIFNPLYQTGSEDGGRSGDASPPPAGSSNLKKPPQLGRRDSLPDFRLGTVPRFSSAEKLPSTPEEPQPGVPSAVALDRRVSGARMLPGRKLTGAKSIEPQGTRQAQLESAADAAAVAGLALAHVARGSISRTHSLVRSPSKAKAALEQLLAVEYGSRSASPVATAAAPALGASGTSGVQELSSGDFQAQVDLGRLLGTGGTGSVLQAMWCGREVAVKLLHPQLQADERVCRSFQREVELMALVGSHPRIMPVLGYCQQPPHCCIIAPLAPGSLHHKLYVEELRPQWGKFLEIAEDLAEAMYFCHTMRPPVVHRDLKPENVLLGTDGRVLLADWGLAKTKARTYLSHENNTPGTPAYTAPEIFQGGKVDERADVFSFGMLLLVLLTGQEPWAELDSSLQIVWAVGVQRRRPPLPDGCPRALGALIQECWRTNAPLRPSFAEIRQRLHQMRSQNQCAPLPKGPQATATRTAERSQVNTAISKIREPQRRPARV